MVFETYYGRVFMAQKDCIAARTIARFLGVKYIVESQAMTEIEFFAVGAL